MDNIFFLKLRLQESMVVCCEEAKSSIFHEASVREVILEVMLEVILSIVHRE